MMLRPAFPNVPMTEFGANAQILKIVPGIHGLLLGSLTRFGRTQLPTVPPQSEVETELPLTSVGVNQFPVEAVTMPASCQPPRIWSVAPEKFPPNGLPLPKGSSYS